MTPTCTRCPALVANRRCIVHGYGDPRAQIMIVGEAPGQHGADRTGVPFTGDRSGRRVQALLIALGLSLETDPRIERPRLQNVYLTNVVRCNPPGNRNPTSLEVANCQPFLCVELDEVRPRVIVALGAFASRWAFDQLPGQRPPAGMRALHGHVWSAGDRHLVCLIHPARASGRQMAQALATLRQVLAGTC